MRRCQRSLSFVFTAITLACAGLFAPQCLAGATGAVDVRPNAVARPQAAVIPDEPTAGGAADASKAPAAQSQSAASGRPDNEGPYVTMCVRACDGYYYPIRQNALAKDFERDAQTCAATCGGEARLFYFSRQGGRPDAMIDTAGHKYADEPHAFEYRKTFNSACTCRSQPWTQEAQARHQGYAEAEAREQAKDRAFQLARAAAQAMTPVPPVPMVAVRPEAPQAKPMADAMAGGVASVDQNSSVADMPADASQRVPEHEGAQIAHTEELASAELPEPRRLQYPRYRIQRFGQPGWAVFGAGNNPYDWPVPQP